MTRRAIVQKWILYCLCALVLLAVQDLILVRIRIGGAGGHSRNAGAQRAVAAVRPVLRAGL